MFADRSLNEPSTFTIQKCDVYGKKGERFKLLCNMLSERVAGGGRVGYLHDSATLLRITDIEHVEHGGTLFSKFKFLMAVCFFFLLFLCSQIMFFLEFEFLFILFF